MERKLAEKSERRFATENKMPAWQSSEKLNKSKELKLHFSPKTEHVLVLGSQIWHKIKRYYSHLTIWEV